ncbi:sulfite exporter TauE/SafE family protein [Thermoflavimicrobium dichotomicum]|uniref:Probable membrane transporter protein n=1 Tax=Thermoflavimicrobium dichotomicum TaxID=46223 RepID=A0A1I3VBY9_9BACL|nr:TSUP family transporter [Thermoflavimicrobium dichotomicum]SFJ91697.1 hypothetical protein SAMN05421852_1388 [Thermoflavimicrobium dichotomicum]
MEDLNLSILLFLIVSGFIAAFIDSVVGGGGLISIPVLLATGLPPSVALGTNKLASTMASLTSTISFMKSGKIHFKLTLYLMPLSLLGSITGAYIVKQIPPDFLKPIIVALLVIVTIFTLIKKDWGTHSTFKGLSVKSATFIAFASLLIGFYDGFMGGGTGSFLLFSFLLIGFDFVKAAGNAKVLNFASNIAALAMFIYMDQVHYTYGLAMGISMILGAWMGSNMAIKKGSAYVKILFIAMTMILISKQVWDLLHV